MTQKITIKPKGVGSHNLDFSSLSASIAIPAEALGLKRFWLFVGPGYMVATGYMDPGNWATALAAGSQFGERLLLAAVLSSLMAILLQALSARLAFGSGQNLAQACRTHFPGWTRVPLWLTQEAAILATDLAEVIGTAIGLKLLFNLPFSLAVVLTALDVYLILAFERFGFRKLEAFVAALLLVIAVCFGLQLIMAQPDWGAALNSLKPDVDMIRNPEMLYLSMGILGATVMPHNLFLHSGLAQTRAVASTDEARKEAYHYAKIDSFIALFFALLINGALLILAASAFYRHDHRDVATIEQAYQLIAPLLGASTASTLFAIALIACGLNSALTATLAGQIVMEGFISLRIKPVWRRLITRSLAIVPALTIAILFGEDAASRLLVLSQVILSFALPFAIAPLVILTASRKIMGPLAAPYLQTLLAGAIGLLITLLNGKLIIDTLAG